MVEQFSKNISHFQDTLKDIRDYILYIHNYIYIKIIARNISTYKHIKTIVSFIFSLQRSVKICYVFFGTFLVQSNVLRLIKVFIVTDLVIQSFYDMFRFAKMYAICCIHMYVYIYVYIHIYMYYTVYIYSILYI